MCFINFLRPFKVDLSNVTGDWQLVIGKCDMSTSGAKEREKKIYTYIHSIINVAVELNSHVDCRGSQAAKRKYREKQKGDVGGVDLGKHGRRISSMGPWTPGSG